MKVIEIFNSIDGEGIRTGQPCTFIRLAGCNLRCTYCDTLYALFGEEEPCEYSEMSVEDILAKIQPRYKRITLTGGEPLIHCDCDKLVDALLRQGYEVNIETNGAVNTAAFRNRVYRSDKLFFTIDYKLPSSGMEDKMLPENFTSLCGKDVIKFVVGSDEDLDRMREIMNQLIPVYDKMPHVFAGVVFGSFEPLTLVNAIINEEIFKDVRYQIQLHKVIWTPEERGV
ncbi:MAG: radical SAM protein [bacterium]|nr:radical SAM protein [bacterium]